MLSDYDQFGPDADRKAEVTRLGLAYHLLTAYTSFVAVDTQVRNAAGSATTVTQPLPMPECVSDQAVGGLNRQAVACAPAPPMMLKARAESYAMAEVAAQDKAGRREKAKTSPGHHSPSFSGNAGVPGLRILAFSGITGTSDPAALHGELAARLLDPALVAALSGLPAGTTMTLQVDGSGQVTAVTFSQAFPGAAKAKVLIGAWRFGTWTGGIAGSMEVTLG
jgi:Ca-activated chloride channel family protein